MKACVLHAKKDLRFEDIPEVEIKEAEEVKVKILGSALLLGRRHRLGHRGARAHRHRP